MSRDLLINSWILAFLNGVSLASWWFGFSLMGLLLPLAMFLWLWWARGRLVVRTLVIVFLIGIIGGAFRMGLIIEERCCAAEIIQTEHWIEGMVTGLPQIKQDQQEIALENLRIDNLEKPKSRLQLKATLMDEINPGDKLVFKSKLVAANDQSLPESYRQNLLRQRIDWRADRVKGLQVERAAGANFMEIIWRMRQFVNQSLAGVVAEPAASLLAGILIGERGNLPKYLSNNFQITGLTHILAISGFNITLIINIILLMTVAIGRKWRWLLCCLLITFFVILTGASASVIRAGVMGLLALSVKTFGRKLPVLKLILISTFLIVIVDPTILNFDLSFQLSLVATLSLIYFADFYTWETPRAWQQWIWEGISLTLAAQVLTLPLIFFGFGKISIISPIANLLIGPLIPVLMLLGVVLLGLVILMPFLAILVGGVTELLVRGMEIVINFLAALPLAQIEFGQGNWLIVVIYYLLVFRFFHKRKLAPN
jgi:competence protein ComEC